MKKETRNSDGAVPSDAEKKHLRRKETDIGVPRVPRLGDDLKVDDVKAVGSRPSTATSTDTNTETDPNKGKIVSQGSKEEKLKKASEGNAE